MSGFGGIHGLSAGLSIPDCYTTSDCRYPTDALCYGIGWFTDFCGQWRNYSPTDPKPSDIPNPSAPKPPVIDTDPNSPTYGQATVDGQVIVTAEQAQRMIDQQIAAKAAADRAAIQAAIGNQASAQCALKAADCGPFTSINADCTDCVFDPSKPLFIVLAFALVGFFMAVKK